MARGKLARVTSEFAEPTGALHAPSILLVADGPGHVEIRPNELQVFVGGRRVGFTVREFEIFTVLAARPDRVVRRADIHEQVWGATYIRRDRSVDVFVRKVRGKLRAISPEWTYIHTHFGIGYRYHPEPRSPGADG